MNKNNFETATWRAHEYVKNANMTSKDNYVVPLIMENKTVTKKILSAAGFHVPGGEEFSSLLRHKKHLRYANKAFVVKPKSTNYGLGITILKKELRWKTLRKRYGLLLKRTQRF